MLIAACSSAETELGALNAFYKSGSPEAKLCAQYAALVSAAHDALGPNDPPEVAADRLALKYKASPTSPDDQARLSEILKAVAETAYGLRLLSKDSALIAYGQVCRRQAKDGTPGFNLSGMMRATESAEVCEKNYPPGVKRKTCVAEAFKTDSPVRPSTASSGSAPGTVQPAPGVSIAGTVSPYKLVDSGFPANEQYQPFWLDNERVVFKGYEPGSYNEAMRKTLYAQAKALGYEGGMKTGYYIWDTKTGKVTLYKDKIEDLCVEDGKSIYRTIPSKEEEKAVVWRGKFGQEQPTDLEPWPYIGLQQNCWAMIPIRTEAQKGRHPIFLRPDWGYLDLGPINPPSDPAALVLYYRTGNPEPIQLQIPRSKLWNGGRAVFAPHDGRHFLVEGRGDSKGMPQAWYLAFDGKLTEIVLPAGPWTSVRLYPVKDGIFLSSPHVKGKSLREPGGAYLIRQGQWQLLFAGFKNRIGVSADGCKVALTVAPNEQAHYARSQEWQAGRSGQQTMRMISVCEESSK